MLMTLLIDDKVLGAWGLGWEVWMDGMEITQFTYFQQVQLTKSVHFFMTPAQITLGLDHTAV